VIGAPSVAVVVPTCNRAGLLERLVAALASQRGAPQFEVVIVDDASTDDTRAVLQRLRADGELLITTERLDENRGPAAARNKGWRTASAPIVAFTDDDCVPDPGWLRALLSALDDVDIVQGRTVPDPAQQHRRGPFSRTLEIESETGFYQTANVAYRREWLEQLDGFDERYRFPAGEDTDLAWRAKQAGARTRFASDAVVYHDVRPSSFFTHLRDVRRWEGVVLLAREVPATRATCHSRWFWRPSHPPALLAGVGLALALSTRGRLGRLVGLLAVLPYVRYRLVRHPLAERKSTRLSTLPLSLVSDLAEVGVLTVASVRYRCLLL